MSKRPLEDSEEEVEDLYASLVAARTEDFTATAKKKQKKDSADVSTDDKKKEPVKCSLPGFEELAKTTTLGFKTSYEKDKKDERRKRELEEKLREKIDVETLRAKDQTKAAAEELKGVVSGDLSMIDPTEKVFSLPRTTWHVPLTSFDYLKEERARIDKQQKKKKPGDTK